MLLERYCESAAYLIDFHHLFSCLLLSYCNGSLLGPIEDLLFFNVFVVLKVKESGIVNQNDF